MQIYLVGGAVRDTLLGLPVKDHDWVVVGASPQQMLDQGFIPVGKDFPVFLHPRSKEEYALARTERKTAPGYRGFAVHAAPDVTLEQDLARRDLTINAMAVTAASVRGDGSFDPQTTLADPFHGKRDLHDRVLRHASGAFREDPVRILRVARLAARFADFTVAPETIALMRTMVAHGEVQALVPERVWQELARGLMEHTPSRLFEVLCACGALGAVLPELGSDSNSGLGHGLRALDLAAGRRMPLPSRFACLCLPLAPDQRAIASLCQRLRVPTDCRELAAVAARELSRIHQCLTLDAAALVNLLERCDAFRKPVRFAELLMVCQCDATARAGDQHTVYPQRQHLLDALAAAQAVNTEAVATRAHAAGLAGKQVGAWIHDARVAAVAATSRPS